MYILISLRLLFVGVLNKDFLHSQSGLGDHGLEGFEDFLKCHKCTPICSAMELCKLSVLANTIQGIKDSSKELEADPDAS